MSSHSAKLTTTGSVMHVLSPENCDSDILVTGMTINDFINEKIKELGSEVSIKDNNMFKFYYESVTP